MSTLAEHGRASGAPTGRLVATIGAALAGAVLLAVAMLAWPHLAWREHQTKFAVVDLATVVRKNQEASVALLAGGGADQGTRDTALASAQSFGKRLDAAVIALSKECACVLLMREAVVAGEVDDMTPALMAQLAKQGGRP